MNKKLERVMDILNDWKDVEALDYTYAPSLRRDMKKAIKLLEEFDEKPKEKIANDKVCSECGKKLGSLKFNAEDGGYMCYSCYEEVN